MTCGSLPRGATQDGKMTPAEMIEVIKAYENEQEIQMSIKDKNNWKTVITPLWNFAELDYRVKPKEKIVYQYLYSDGGHPSMYRASIGFYETIEEAQSQLKTHQAIRRLDYTKTIIEE